MRHELMTAFIRPYSLLRFAFLASSALSDLKTLTGDSRLPVFGPFKGSRRTFVSPEASLPEASDMPVFGTNSVVVGIPLSIISAFLQSTMASRRETPARRTFPRNQPARRGPGLLIVPRHNA